MSGMELLHFHLAEIVLSLAAGFILLIDRLVFGNRPAVWRYAAASWLATAACAATGFLDPSPAALAIVFLAACAALFGNCTRMTIHAGEYFLMLLLATVGLLLMVKADTLLMAFLAMEMASLCLYIMVAFDKGRASSAESAFKYYLFGGVAAACMLYGFSLLYGLTGTLELEALGVALAKLPPSPLLVASLVLVLVGFGFKAAAAPFHLWAPDAYQGAPTPVASFIASGSKIAGLFLFARLFGSTFVEPHVNGWQWSAWVPTVLLMSVASMIWGNLAALGQTSVKRLLAYSAIAHSGYLLLGFAYGGQGGMPMQALAYSIITYALAAAGAFGVITVVESQRGSDDLQAFRGLMRRSPVLALLFGIFILSLAGIPPLSGFFGKFFVFAAVASATHHQGHWIGLVGLGIGTSAISLYYYLQILKRVFVEEAEAEAVAAPAPKLCLALVVLLVLGALVVGTGVAPAWLLEWVK